MSRFSNLEFDRSPERQKSGPAVLKDGAFYLEDARKAFYRGRFSLAMRAYSKVLEYDSKSVEAWIGQVRMLIELGEFREASLWADKAMEVIPDEADLLAAKAIALARLGDARAALAYSDSAVEARGNTPYVWIARGDVFLARKEKRADFCFEKAVELASGAWLAQWMISRSYFFYRRFSRAFKYAQQSVSLDAAQPAPWLQFGRCQLALGLVGPASNSFTQARQLDPECRPDEDEMLRLSDCGFASWICGRVRQWLGR